MEFKVGDKVKVLSVPGVSLDNPFYPHGEWEIGAVLQPTNENPYRYLLKNEPLELVVWGSGLELIQEFDKDFNTLGIKPGDLVKIIWPGLAEYVARVDSVEKHGVFCGSGLFPWDLCKFEVIKHGYEPTKILSNI